MVELNPVLSLYNNVFSTYYICKAAYLNSIPKTILISSDKAVRPTNVMGASKRLSELIIQGFAEKSNITIFSMVRFGNVIGSSGSVVPLFRNQILNGGPITITDPRIIRYFMTIEEASQLVIQASTMSEGGDVFLLDMGEPILIKDLAIKMIKLMGKTLKDEENDKGEIEIKTIGLRPGEKLYEELLIDGKSVPTEHPNIQGKRNIY